MSDLDGLLAHAALLPDAPGQAALRVLGAELAKYAATLDLDHAWSLVATDPRAYLGRHDSGPIVALRRYDAGEVSAVHSHAWTILYALAGGGALERWQPDDAGRARLIGAEATAAAPVIIDAYEAHRQRTTAGALELVVIGDYSDSSPRADYVASEDSLVFAEQFAGFLAAWQAADIGALAPFYAEDVFLDLHVPKWRVQMEGSQRVLAFIDAEEFHPDYSVPRWSVAPTPDGWTLELQAHYSHNGDRSFSEMVHRVRTASPGGPITSHSVYCTGIWDRATIDGLRHSGGLLRL